MAALSSQPYAETQRPSRLLEGLCVVVGRGTRCQMATRWRELHPKLSKCHDIGSACAGHDKPLSRVKPVCSHSAPITNLQLHPRIWGHPNMVITPLSAELFIGMLTFCLCVHLSGAEQTQLHCLRRPHWSLARSAMIWHYPTASWGF